MQRRHVTASQGMPMPVLKNAKHETFAQNIVARAKTGWSNTECYRRAGYAAEGNAAEACASKLLRSAKVGARIAELTAPAARKQSITVATLIDELDETRERALGADQLSTARQVSMDKAKLKGMLVEQIALGGPHDFPGCETPRDVVLSLIDDHGGDARSLRELLKGMMAIVEDIIAVQARTVAPRPA
jgi:hypothetical protein